MWGGGEGATMSRRLIGFFILGSSILLPVSIAVGIYHLSLAADAIARSNFHAGEAKAYRQLPESVKVEHPPLRQDSIDADRAFKRENAVAGINRFIAILSFGFAGLVVILQMLMGFVALLSRPAHAIKTDPENSA